MPRQAGHDIRTSGQAKPGRCGATSERPHREGDGRLGVFIVMRKGDPGTVAGVTM